MLEQFEEALNKYHIAAHLTMREWREAAPEEPEAHAYYDELAKEQCGAK